MEDEEKSEVVEETIDEPVSEDESEAETTESTETSEELEDAPVTRAEFDKLIARMDSFDDFMKESLASGNTVLHDSEDEDEVPDTDEETVKKLDDDFYAAANEYRGV